MLLTRLANPDVMLRSVVWCYGQSEGQVDNAPLVVPLVARPKEVVTFFFGDPYRVHLRGSDRSGTSPPTVVVGPQTNHRLDLSVIGTIDTFTIHFQPAGFHHLFGIPMAELTNTTYDAPAVLGKKFHTLWQPMADTRSFSTRIRLVEQLLIDRLQDAGALDPVGTTANWLFADHGRSGVVEMAARSFLTRRQFERRFLTQVGVSPKRYARIIRFNAALDRKLCMPDRTWTAIAYELGYHDQMHMVHDFHDLAGDTPSRIISRLETVPEFRTAYAMSTRSYTFQ